MFEGDSPPPVLPYFSLLMPEMLGCEALVLGIVLWFPASVDPLDCPAALGGPCSMSHSFLPFSGWGHDQVQPR